MRPSCQRKGRHLRPLPKPVGVFAVLVLRGWLSRSHGLGHPIDRVGDVIECGGAAFSRPGAPISSFLVSKDAVLGAIGESRYAATRPGSERKEPSCTGHSAGPDR